MTLSPTVGAFEVHINGTQEAALTATGQNTSTTTTINGIFLNGDAQQQHEITTICVPGYHRTSSKQHLPGRADEPGPCRNSIRDQQ